MVGEEARAAGVEGRDWGRRAAVILHRQLGATEPHPAIRSEMLRRVDGTLRATAERIGLERGHAYAMAWETAVRAALLDSFVAAVQCLGATGAATPARASAPAPPRGWDDLAA